MKKVNKIAIILGVYIAVILLIYASMFYPATVKPKSLIPTNIPSLSISGLKEVDSLFSSYGKVWIGYPEKPDLSQFTFGQTNLIQ